MRIGVGGKLGPLRGGISTRGIGVGAGPLSAGSSWRGKRSKSGGGAMFIAFLLVAFWPMLAVSLIASLFGAADSSVTTVLMWIAEGAWIALVVLALVGSLLGKKPASQPKHGNQPTG